MKAASSSSTSRRTTVAYSVSKRPRGVAATTTLRGMSRGDARSSTPRSARRSRRESSVEGRRPVACLMTETVAIGCRRSATRTTASDGVSPWLRNSFASLRLTTWYAPWRSANAAPGRGRERFRARGTHSSGSSKSSIAALIPKAYEWPRTTPLSASDLGIRIRNPISDEGWGCPAPCRSKSDDQPEKGRCGTIPGEAAVG